MFGYNIFIVRMYTSVCIDKGRWRGDRKLLNETFHGDTLIQSQDNAYNTSQLVGHWVSGKM